MPNDKEPARFESNPLLPDLNDPDLRRKTRREAKNIARHTDASIDEWIEAVYEIN
jgi:hypothetical protein